MVPEVFSSDDRDDAQAAFQRWQADNPTGFYVNRKSATTGMLHRVGCPHVGHPGDWDPDFGDIARSPKVCAPERAALESWARKYDLALAECGDCRPFAS